MHKDNQHFLILNPRNADAWVVSHCLAPWPWRPLLRDGAWRRVALGKTLKIAARHKRPRGGFSTGATRV
jgi:hypothetical protein